MGEHLYDTTHLPIPDSEMNFNYQIKFLKLYLNNLAKNCSDITTLLLWEGYRVVNRSARDRGQVRVSRGSLNAPQE